MCIHLKNSIKINKITIKLKGEIDKSVIKIGDFITPVSKK